MKMAILIEYAKFDLALYLAEYVGRNQKFKGI